MGQIFSGTMALVILYLLIPIPASALPQILSRVDVVALAR